MRRPRLRITTALAASAVSLCAAVAAADPVAATQDKQQVLLSWTGTSKVSYDAWLSARNHRGDWAEYDFDWSTDYCSASPDNPFGFPFGLSCARHDFGYRNYRAAGKLRAHKQRLDSAFHQDLKRVCASRTGTQRDRCDHTAWTYYQAAKSFG